MLILPRLQSRSAGLLQPTEGKEMSEMLRWGLEEKCGPTFLVKEVIAQPAKAPAAPAAEFANPTELTAPGEEERL